MNVVCVCVCVCVKSARNVQHCKNHIFLHVTAEYAGCDGLGLEPEGHAETLREIIARGGNVRSHSRAPVSVSALNTKPSKVDVGTVWLLKMKSASDHLLADVRRKSMSICKYTCI